MSTAHLPAKWRVLVGLLVIAIGLVPATASAAGLFDRIGIGADWGPHWATSPSAGDLRDNQADGAFPAEICLLRNAGFKTIRMYGENAATWIAVLDAVDAYNTGKLNCDPAGGPAQDCTLTNSCMSVVYQAAICGPDPRSLEWNGSYAAIDQVKCYEVGPSGSQPVAQERGFKDSVEEELLKLSQVITYAGAAFAAHVPLVFVGNEVLFSRGVCSTSGAACTDNRDCGTGTCNIGHYCSNALSSATPSATCSSSATCRQGGTCTDVTNVAPLTYAFSRVTQALAAQLGSTVPAISMSVQMDLLVSSSFGDDPKTAPVMWSRQQFAQALPSKVVSVNTYPDQWGKVTIGQLPTTCTGGSFPSCVGAQNAVNGAALLPGCVDDPRYRDPVTGKIAHTIDNYYGRLRTDYPGFEVVIAETGWHTGGTCVAYNDCASAYTAADAATYYKDLYAYVQKNQISLLAFEPFDQRTKQCDPAGRAPGAMAEANYGIFTNVCQLKGGSQTLLPPAGPGSLGPNLTAFTALLDDDATLGGKSCRAQTLVEVAGFGSSGVCEHNTTTACLSGFHAGDPSTASPRDNQCPPGPAGADNRCVWGYCASNTALGCNPNDPDNPSGCGECRRAGNCYSPNAPQPGLFAATVDCAGSRCVAACRNDQSCDGARAPFTDTGQCGTGDFKCACYVAMAPATLPIGDAPSSVEAPGFALAYSRGSFQFTKERTLIPEVVPGTHGFEVSPVWGNVFLGSGWTLSVVNPPDTTVSAPGPCPPNTVSALDVSDPLNPTITWAKDWAACSYQVGGVRASRSDVFFPRGYLTDIPTWPQPVFCLFGVSSSGASDCGSPEPIRVSFEGTSGKAQNVGVASDKGNLRISGRFRSPVPIRLDRAFLRIEDLIDEVDGVGELSRRANGGLLLPVDLPARSGSKATEARFQTATGVRPSVTVEVKRRDAKTGLTEFSITVDRDSMPVKPVQCLSLKTRLRTAFTLDDGSGPPIAVTATLPWQCKGTELRMP